jgi:hypothetical protein
MAKARDAFRRAAGSGPAKRRPSGSEKRKRAHPRSIRFTPEEERLIADREQATGLSFAALVRHGLFNTPPPRATRHPPVEIKAAARVLAALGKIGSNVNQLAHYAHQGKFHSVEIDMALRDLAELRIACLKALGQEPDDPAFDDEGR